MKKKGYCYEENIYILHIIQKGKISRFWIVKKIPKYATCEFWVAHLIKCIHLGSR